MAMRVETNPLEMAYAVLLEHGLEGAGEALRILVNEAAKIERSQFLGAAPYERSERRRDYANGYKPKTVLTRLGELTFQVPQVRCGDFNAPDKAEAERLLKAALDTWRKEHPKLAEWAETAIPESLTVFDFPAAHRIRLRTTNGLERISAT